MKNILIVAPHPDDETLGAGGTLLKHRAAGDKITWLVMTEMPATYPQAKRDLRKAEIEKVSKMYGFDKTFVLPFEAIRLDAYPLADLVSKVSEVFLEVKPEVVYLANRSDVHSDHRRAFEVVLSCTKAFRYPFLKRILMYETPSETDFAAALPEDAFVPNVFSDITPFLEKKLEILSIFESELGRHPFPRSLEGVKALATVRGAAAHVTYAEAFVLLKEIG